MENEANKCEINFEKCDKKKCICKGCMIFIATLIGAFLAFYFAVDMTLKMIFSPEYHMRRADKMIERMNRDIEQDINKDIKIFAKVMPNPVNIMKDENAYKVMIELKPFGNMAKNLKISVDNGNMLKIEGTHEVKKGDKENLMNMVQTYMLENKVDVNKMTKKEEHGKYIIMLPIVED